MNSNNGLLEVCQRMLWLDREMEKNYADYLGLVSDNEMKSAFEQLRADEARHVNMEEKIMTMIRDRKQKG